MNLGEAVAIFRNIYNSEKTPAKKKQAIKIVVDMETHNSITKQEILNALDWLSSQEDCGSKWIPCSERLPETRNNILICQRSGYVSIGYYSQKEFLDLNSYPFENVIAWQPLPEPYNEP